MRRGACLLSTVVLLGACGGGKSATVGAAATGGGSVSTAVAPARGNSNLILEAEIVGSGSANALEAIQRLRPAMLRGRGSSQIGEGSGTEQIQVYVDGIPSGGLSAAAGVAAMTVKEIRYINASDATTRFGTGHAMGAILITTKRR